MARTRRQHGLWSFSVLLGKQIQESPRLVVFRLQKMALEVVHGVADMGEVADGTFAVQVVVVVAVDMRAELRKSRPSGRMLDIPDGNGFLCDMLLVVESGSLDTNPAHLIHNHHDLDCWNQGYVWVEEAEILT